MSVVFTQRADGSIFADCSSSLNEGDVDTISIRRAPGRVVGDVIRFSQASEASKGMVANALPVLPDGSYAVVNGVAEYIVTGVNLVNYTVVRGST